MVLKAKIQAKKLLSCFIVFSVLLTSFVFAAPTKANAQVNGLPAQCVIGYWENWSSSETANMTLREIDPGWDVIIVSFMLTDSSQVRAVFSPDSSLYPSGDQAFINDVAYCQARGQKVLISLGGATGNLTLNTDSDRKTFYDSACAIIEKYGFDGIDIDLEHSILSVSSADTLTNMATPIQAHLNTILHDMVKKYGSDFMVTMAPEHPYVQGGAVAWRGFYGGYLPLLNNCRDILTFIHPQYYNNPINEYNGEYWGCPTFGASGYNVNSLVVLSELLITGFETKVGFFEGLRPDQVAFGVPASSEAAGSGYLPLTDYAQALDTLIKKYPTFRGIMTWSINYDVKANNNGFVNTMRSVFPTVTVPVTVDAISADKTGTVTAGSQVTWNASASGGTGSLTYQFELYQNNSLIKTQAYSSASAFSAVLSNAGTYYVKVTAKDSAGTTAFKNSASIIVNAVQEPLRFANLAVSPSGAQNVGTKFTVTASVTGGTGTKTYTYYLYKSGKLCYQAVNAASNSFSYTANSSGKYLLLVYCKDGTGTVVSSNLSFTVN